MSDTTLFISATQNHSELADVAAKVFQLLAVREWEERFSANYPPDEHYFAGYAENAQITICDSDDDRMPDYPFHIWIKKPSWRGGTGIVPTEPHQIAKMLASCGFSVFIPQGAWYRTDWDGQGDFYTD